MRSHLRKCPACGLYTLKASCGSCGAATRVAAPARFSPEDHYGVYRRRLKRELEGESSG
ncbi:MAG: RNA-protein complex protein Nop10 [Thermoplasmata archaeon]